LALDGLAVNVSAALFADGFALPDGIHPITNVNLYMRAAGETVWNNFANGAPVQLGAVIGFAAQSDDGTPGTSYEFCADVDYTDEPEPE
jgi:hypothetical protein